VQDLLALTHALSHPADRLAWLACLRAPWCGLTLADLHALAGTDTQDASDEKEAAQIQQELFPETAPRSEPQTRAPGAVDARTLWERLHDGVTLARLSEDGHRRLARLREVFGRAMEDRLRSLLRERVENAWLALGGPACVVDDTDLEDAEIYLDYLEECEEAGDLADPPAFERGLAELYALPDLHAAAEDPQVLTIHKAKGLEFDTVIVPGLGSGTGRDERKLFIWLDRPVLEAGGRSRLLIAPINPTGSDEDATYEYIRRLDREKESHEEARLLYVAATRAKKHLHLLGDVSLETHAKEPAPRTPRKGSLLAKLWPAVESEFIAAAHSSPLLSEEGSGRSPGGGEAINQDLRRLPADWKLPDLPPAAVRSAPPDRPREQETIEFSWAGETARRVGAVVHRWLQRIAEDELRGWDRKRLETMREPFRRELAVCGVHEAELEAATARVATALGNMLEDPRGRWLLGPQSESRNEYRLTAVIDEERRTLIIDRTFLDPDGKRWIVDYKTSSHEGADVEAFLEREKERYRAQLERYAAVLSDSRGVGLSLYFPLLGGWRAWEGENAP
jgi:ATP-dependent exoDNAse (exonuclease V) beta subunit